MKRFAFGTSHAYNIGQPVIIEHPQGEYMLVADHEALMAACEAHNEMLLARTKRAEGMLCKCEN